MPALAKPQPIGYRIGLFSPNLQAMGNRLSKIYTRTGDAGDTGLGDGVRIAKDAARVEAFGTVDELNSTVGLLLASATSGSGYQEA